MRENEYFCPECNEVTGHTISSFSAEVSRFVYNCDKCGMKHDKVAVDLACPHSAEGSKLKAPKLTGANILCNNCHKWTDHTVERVIRQPAREMSPAVEVDVFTCKECLNTTREDFVEPTEMFMLCAVCGWEGLQSIEKGNCPKCTGSKLKEEEFLYVRRGLTEATKEMLDFTPGRVEEVPEKPQGLAELLRICKDIMKANDEGGDIAAGQLLDRKFYAAVIAVESAVGKARPTTGGVRKVPREEWEPLAKLEAELADLKLQNEERQKEDEEKAAGALRELSDILLIFEDLVKWAVCASREREDEEDTINLMVTASRIRSFILEK